MSWLVDPKTREMLGPIPSREREIAYNATHWRPGWRSGIVRENGVPVRMWFALCPDECCREIIANWPALEADSRFSPRSANGSATEIPGEGLG